MSKTGLTVSFHARNDARLVPFDLPELTAGKVRVKARFTLVSSGTELAYFAGNHHEVRSKEATYPMGARGSYSFCGEVVECGEGVTTVSPGQLVAMMGVHSSEAVVDESKLMLVPEGVTAPQASFAVVGGIALHGVRMAGIGVGHSVAVTGLGLIGQLTAQICRIAGAKVIATDRSAARVRCALKCGIEQGLVVGKKKLAESLGRQFPNGINHAVETSGSQKALEELLEALNPEGVISLLGCPHEPVTLDLYTHLQRKQLRLVGAYQPRCPDEPNAFYPWSKRINRLMILEWIGKGQLDVDELLSIKSPPADVQNLYEQLLKQDEAVAGGIDWTKL